MSKSGRLTRRHALQVATLTTALPLVHIRTVGAAGRLNVGFWDHWVPGGTEKMRQQVEAWANKNKVDVTADFITSQGNKLLLTAAAEAQAKTGHDFIPFLQWDAINYADNLEPVDDVIQSLSKKYGKYDPVVRTATATAALKPSGRRLMAASYQGLLKRRAVMTNSVKGYP